MISKIVSTPWHTMRWLRLAMGLYLLFVSYSRKEFALSLFGALFLYQALFDVGCCGAQGCAVPAGEKKAPVKRLENTEAENIS